MNRKIPKQPTNSEFYREFYTCKICTYEQHQQAVLNDMPSKFHRRKKFIFNIFSVILNSITVNLVFDKFNFVFLIIQRTSTQTRALLSLLLAKMEIVTKEDMQHIFRASVVWSEHWTSLQVNFIYNCDIQLCLYLPYRNW